MLTAEELIQHLNLEALDREGGFYRRTVESPHRITNRELGAGYRAEGNRPIGSVIYFLMTTHHFSAMHRLSTAETWFYHLGDPMEMLLLHPNGDGETLIMGPDITSGQHVQATCPARVWQGARLLGSGMQGYTLCSAAMSPGFQWADFELGDATNLVAQYPAWDRAIRLRAREGISGTKGQALQDRGPE